MTDDTDPTASDPHIEQQSQTGQQDKSPIHTSVESKPQGNAPLVSKEKVPTRKPYNWLGNYQQIINKRLPEPHLYIPTSLRSSLIYIVLENELSLKNKRRIVSLTVDDLLYTSITSKCMFQQINWTQDFYNVIKVHESNHTWEASFSELIQTRPIALRSLFAHSEVWAEGHYQALI